MKARAAPRQMRTCNEREAPCTPSTSCQGVTVVPSNSSYEAFLSHLHSFHEHSGRRGPSFEKASSDCGHASYIVLAETTAAFHPTEGPLAAFYM